MLWGGGGGEAQGYSIKILGGGGGGGGASYPYHIAMFECRVSKQSHVEEVESWKK